MTPLARLPWLAAVSLRVDGFTILMLLGVAQGLVLSVFFLTRPGLAVLTNRLLGLLQLALSCIALEVLLCYSGFIVKALYLVDFSEALNFAVGPLLYLYVLTRVFSLSSLRRRQILHFLPYAFYAGYWWFFGIQNADVKYNAFLDAYHPDLFPRDAPTVGNPDPWGIRGVINELTVLHLSVYSALSLAVVIRWARRSKLSWLSRESAELAWLRTFSVLGLVCAALLVVVKLSFRNDTGDHWIVLVLTAVFYAITFGVLRSSPLLTEPARELGRTNQKYEKSSLTDAMRHAALSRLEQAMDLDKLYLDPTLSLGDLAKAVGVTPHHLSQILNQEKGRSFFEFLAEHRVREAQRLLTDPVAARWKIHEIGEKVGYYSKSAFNTAFKKETGTTPSAFRRDALSDSRT